jgi:hypothetical protein
MPTPDDTFYFRNLPAATLDSRSLLATLLRNLVEGVSVAVKDGELSRVFLEPPADTVGVLGIEFHEASLPAAALTRDQG